MTKASHHRLILHNLSFLWRVIPRSLMASSNSEPENLDLIFVALPFGKPFVTEIAHQRIHTVLARHVTDIDDYRSSAANTDGHILFLGENPCGSPLRLLESPYFGMSRLQSAALQRILLFHLDWLL